MGKARKVCGQSQEGPWAKPGRRVGKAMGVHGRSQEGVWAKPWGSMDKARKVCGQSHEGLWTKPGRSVDKARKVRGHSQEVGKSRKVCPVMRAPGYNSIFPPPHGGTGSCFVENVE